MDIIIINNKKAADLAVFFYNHQHSISLDYSLYQYEIVFPGSDDEI
jgi:hypothetical protein